MKFVLAALTAAALAFAPSVATAHRYVHRHHAYHHRVRHEYRTYGHRYVAETRPDDDHEFGLFQPFVDAPRDVIRGVGGVVGAIVGGRPAGCPHAYCGCGTSLYFFHRIVGSLNLAANWLRFPHVAPQAGVAAVAPSRHHVLAVVRHVSGMNFLVHDSNSGHGLTRDHVRNLSGYTFVDPVG